jgi:hypothetical protein
MPRRDLTPALVLTLGLAVAFQVVPGAGLLTSALAAEGVVTLQSDPAADAAEREKLFGALAKAANAAEAQEIASQLWTLWFKAPNDAAALMQQALDRRTGGGSRGRRPADQRNRTSWAKRGTSATMRYLPNDFDGLSPTSTACWRSGGISARCPSALILITRAGWMPGRQLYARR